MLVEMVTDIKNTKMNVENRLASKKRRSQKIAFEYLAAKLLCCGTIICNTRFYCGKRNWCHQLGIH
jgi:hypothetical protein